jgi:hypothetical protein
VLQIITGFGLIDARQDHIPATIRSTILIRKILSIEQHPPASIAGASPARYYKEGDALCVLRETLEIKVKLEI